MELVANAYLKYSGQKLRHWVISFSQEDNISLESVMQIANKAAEFYKSRYQIIYAIHTDTDNVHVHFVMNRVSYSDGNTYDGKYSDFYAYLNYLKNLCSEYGIKLVTVTA